MLEQTVGDDSLFTEEAASTEAAGVPDGSTEDYNVSNQGSRRALPPSSSGNVESEEDLPVADEVDMQAYRLLEQQKREIREMEEL